MQDMMQTRKTTRWAHGRFKQREMMKYRHQLTDLKIRLSSRSVLLAAVTKCSKAPFHHRYAGRIDGRVALQQAKELAKAIGYKFWGTESKHVVKVDGERALRWPQDDHAYV
jgi:hypothetical protein